jgi:hypothetical protein
VVSWRFLVSLLCTVRCVFPSRRSNISVPDMGAGCCLEPEGNGVSLGEGGEGGPSPPRGEGDKQSVLSKGRDNMDQDEEERASRV